jgi:putative two-component system response regulator
MDRVLVVDDETGIRGLLTQWVESFGDSAVEASTAECALERLAEVPCEIAVCDVNLPGHDGLWLARRIRQLCPNTAVVFATGTQDLDSAVGGLRAGVVDYLVKPFGRERFREAVDRAREWHRRVDAAFRRRRSAEMELEGRLRQLTESVVRMNPGDDAAVKGLVGMTTVRDRTAYEHALRVAALAGDVAERTSLDEATRGDLERAALLHEVARQVIPETILWKPGDLSDDEWQMLRREPQLGFELFSRVPFLAPAASILRDVRERHDGSGYPRRLAGDAIPLASRILAVADAYDTMTRPRGHREPLTPSQAVEEIVAGRGAQFAPSVADLMLDLLGHAGPR